VDSYQDDDDADSSGNRKRPRDSWDEELDKGKVSINRPRLGNNKTNQLFFSVLRHPVLCLCCKSGSAVSFPLIRNTLYLSDVVNSFNTLILFFKG
jgi:hypothetical protein